MCTYVYIDRYLHTIVIPEVHHPLVDEVFQPLILGLRVDVNGVTSVHCTAHACAFPPQGSTAVPDTQVDVAIVTVASAQRATGPCQQAATGQ